MPWETDTTTTQDFRLSPSLAARGVKRFKDLRQETPSSWVIAGNTRLNDTHTAYRVTIEDEQYECSCFALTHGDTRRRKGCSHVAAVVLWRKREAALAKMREPEPEPVAEVPDRDDPRFGEPPFPEWFQGFRRPQWDAIDAAHGMLADGAKAVIVQAPTGAGKSHIGETVGRLVGGDTLYVCTTKTLQDQMVRAYPYGQVLKGRANYQPQAGNVDAWGRFRTRGDSKVTCADCTAGREDPSCRWCPEPMACPYKVARAKAQAARLAILNTSYFLVDGNKGGRNFSGRDLVVADEADLLEGEVLGQVEVHISRRQAVELHLPPPERKTVESAWPPWVEGEAIPRVARRLEQLPRGRDASVAEIRERKRLVELLERLRILAIELPEGGWVYDGYQQGDITFRPVKVDGWGASMLWPHGKQFLLMSASIISADELASSLGLTEGYRFLDVPMSFPAANRPVRVVGIAENTFKNREKAWPKMVQGVAGVMALHPDDRILVHTVSYAFAEYLMRELPPSVTDGRTVLTYKGAAERDLVLAEYLAHPGAVLLAPSMDRGVDLPGDACRVQVVVKVPFPNTADKQVNARLHSAGGQAWYAVATARTLVQMTGRGIRGPDDHAITYILDHAFTTNVWRKSKNLLPSWWREALDTKFPARRLFLRAQVNPI